MNTNNSNTIKLSDAQFSALECRAEGLDPMTLAAWDGGRTLRFEDSDREELWSELNEASNCEDDRAIEQGCKFAGRAARSLATLAGKVLGV